MWVMKLAEVDLQAGVVSDVPDWTVGDFPKPRINDLEH